VQIISRTEKTYKGGIHFGLFALKPSALIIKFFVTTLSYYQRGKKIDE
jgi:hypothetical protein